MDQDFIRHIIDSGGSIVEASTLVSFAPPTGYAIGLADYTTYEYHADALAETVRRVACAYSVVYVAVQACLDGYFHIDPVEYVEGRTEAFTSALRRNQSVIWSFADRCALPVLHFTE